MAKVILEADKKKVLDVNTYILGRMVQEEVTQTMMANHIGCSRQTLRNRLFNGELTYKDLLMIFDKLNFSDDEILAFMRLRRKL